MKEIWMATGLAALLVLPLAGCGGNRTGSDVTAPTPSAGITQASPSPSAMLDPDAGSDDLAGADGVVGGDAAGDIGAGNTGHENHSGQADNSPLEDLGEGVKDTLDDMGSAARQMGRDAQRAIEGR